MTREEKRAKQGRIRSAEYQRQKRADLRIFWTSVFLFAGVPILWYGAVEFGLVHPIQTTDFKSAVRQGGTVVLLVMLWYIPKAWRYLGEQRFLTEEADKPARSTT